MKLLASILLFPLVTAHAASAPACAAPTHAAAVLSLANLPAPVRAALQSTAKDIVDANQPFNSTDVVRHGAHFNRFAFAWSRYKRWVIVTEHGGIACHNPVYVLNEEIENKPLELQKQAYTGDVCAQALQLLQKQ